MDLGFSVNIIKDYGTKMEFSGDLVFEFIVFFLNMVAWIFVFSLGMAVLKYFLVDRQQNEETRQEWIEKINDIVHRVDVEKHGEIYYWYDADDGEFLGQGHSEQECINHVRERFPTHLFLFTNNKYIKAPDWHFKNYTIQE